MSISLIKSLHIGLCGCNKVAGDRCYGHIRKRACGPGRYLHYVTNHTCSISHETKNEIWFPWQHKDALCIIHDKMMSHMGVCTSLLRHAHVFQRTRLVGLCWTPPSLLKWLLSVVMRVSCVHTKVVRWQSLRKTRYIITLS